MQATSKRRFLCSAVVVGAALAHALPGLWAVCTLVRISYIEGPSPFIAGPSSFPLFNAHYIFRITAACTAFWGLWLVGRALKQKTVSEAATPAIIVCIVGGVILLEAGVLWFIQTERLLDALPEFTAGAVVILAAQAIAGRWPLAKYAASTTVLLVISLYVIRYGRSFVGAIDVTTLPWQSLVAYAARVSEPLSLTLPLVLLDLLSDTSDPSNQLET